MSRGSPAVQATTRAIAGKLADFLRLRTAEMPRRCILEISVVLESPSLAAAPSQPPSTGPDRLSGAERAALIADITGRRLAFLVLTEAQLRAGLTQAGLPVAVVNTVIGILA